MMLTPSCCSLHTNANICIRDLKKERRGGKNNYEERGGKHLMMRAKLSVAIMGQKLCSRCPVSLDFRKHTRVKG